MDVIWLIALGLLLGGWFVLDGFNLGLGMLLPFLGRDEAERRTVLAAMGPFFLAGEVWLVGTAGVLAGAFPFLEADLLHGLYLLIVALLLSWVLRDAGVWFRSRRESARWRRGWDRVIVGGSFGLAGSAGLLIGNVLDGVPLRGASEGLGILDPFAVLCAATVIAIFAVHGAAFGALKLPREHALRAGRLGMRLVPVVLALAGASTVLGFLFTGVRESVVLPWPALAVVVIGVLAVPLAGRMLAAGHEVRAFALTALAAATPVLTVGAGLAPRLLEGVAHAMTLDRLSMMALPVIPVLVLLQVWMWWVFRRRVGADSVVFF
ncbi:cytochrome d ubiquinol oxidase subunit II [Rhizohabitans arisaemae]|uniref:cytochrome d ubiquinol oxidase subunit II n=1 Tax=Rhizohabitans arisaemae TaxID=2720610 RepID=UPI0024B212A9|nr:cytochrome d ubiquinol oxidase subunit II [Rhizohabitans arisaemae]